MSMAPQLPESSDAELHDSDDHSDTMGLEAVEPVASDHQAASVKEKMVYAVSLQYNRLLSLKSAGGGVFKQAGRPWWTPLHLPPEFSSNSNICTIVLESSTLPRRLVALCD